MGSDTAIVTVNNVTPSALSATAVANTINENGSTTVSGSFLDPGSADTHTVVIAWGDSTPNTVINLGAGDLTYSASHTYLDDNPTSTISDLYAPSVTVLDDDGGSVATTTSVRVNNLAPTAVAPIFNFNPITGAATAAISFGDVGTQDSHSVTFNWGDGSSTTVALASSPVTASHPYAVGCVASAPNVVVTDDDSGSATHTYAGGLDHYRRRSRRRSRTVFGTS